MLYCGRYLIVLLDGQDEIEQVLDSAREYAKAMELSLGCAYRHLRWKLRGEKQDSRMVLIDCKEKHEDIFAEEDEEFLKFMENERASIKNEKRAARMGISMRTFYRRGYNKKNWEENI